jgi:hypothetical protein
MNAWTRLRGNPAVGWAAVAVGGLILALVAAQGPSGGAAGGRPAARLLLAVPAPVTVALYGLFGLAVLCTVWLLIPSGLRRRKQDEESFDPVQELPKASPWFVVALLGLSALPLALVGYLLWRGWSRFEVGKLGLPPAAGVFQPRIPAAPEAFLPSVTEPWFSGAVTVLALAAGAGCLALAVWLLLGGRPIGSWDGRSARSRAPEDLLDAIDDSLDALRREPDARRAIVGCYRRFEHAVRRRGLPRAPWETPTEFMRTALLRLPLPPDVVTQLIDLLYLARFSDHPLGSRERDHAVDALVALRGTLEGVGTGASTR